KNSRPRFTHSTPRSRSLTSLESFALCRNLAGVEGFEPPSPGFGVRCSSRSSYTPETIGGGLAGPPRGPPHENFGGDLPPSPPRTPAFHCPGGSRPPHRSWHRPDSRPRSRLR